MLMPKVFRRHVFITLNTNIEAVKTIEKNNFPPILFESWPERCADVPAKKIRESLFAFIQSLGYSIIQVQGPTDDMFLATKN